MVAGTMGMRPNCISYPIKCLYDEATEKNLQQDWTPLRQLSTKSSNERETLKKHLIVAEASICRKHFPA